MFYIRCPYCDREIEMEAPLPDIGAGQEWEESCPHCGRLFIVWWEPCYEARPLASFAAE